MWRQRTLLKGYSLYVMTEFDIVMGSGPIIVLGLIQGVGMGFVFVPLNSLRQQPGTSPSGGAVGLNPGRRPIAGRAC